MKIKKVLLMAPPAISSKRVRDINPLPPMGLGYLAAVLESMGLEVAILDCLVRGWHRTEEVDQDNVRIGLSDEDIRAFLDDFNPDLVGINCHFSRQHRMYHHLSRLVKKVKPGGITVAGGAHATVCPEEMLQDPNIDFVVVGEGEEALAGLIGALNRGSEPTGIDGLCWKNNGNLQLQKKTSWCQDLDALPFPAYHLMHLDLYFGLNESHGSRRKSRFCPIITSRGCPAKCTFCTANQVWGNRYRTRSVDSVIAEMRLLKDKYGIEEIMFEDDNVTAQPRRAKELFSRMIAEEFNFIWDTPNGVGIWSINEVLIDLMQQSGCVQLNFPIESGSQFVLEHIIKKPVKLGRAKELMAHCQKIGLSYSMFLVIGMPGEKLADMWKSFRYAADCGCYNPHISVATPYPGSQLFNNCVEHNWFSKPFSLDDLYIRSFLIQTDDWNQHDLRRTLLLGHLYFKWRLLMDDPPGFFSWFKHALKIRGRLWGYFRNSFFPG
jgi:anaerobic magnesium-protoporphyrin IX monomethyl ester cyclase